ncbi:MAG TPA: glucokinase [Candidatus Xenobia bacterium]|nr:glucokinase [Candidatus Xenobia bacterium]
MILAGDIGGTKSLLALYPPGGDPRRPVHGRSLPSREYSRLSDCLKDFLDAAREKVTFACLGIAGPVVGGRSVTPNLPWETVDATELRQALDAEVVLLNDLEAKAYGIATLRPEELHCLHPGKPATGNAALIAPGTGLGECILFWDGKMHRPSASEGGHCSFAPRNEIEIGLLRYLLRKYHHVSFDRIVSGKGLVNIYNYLRESGSAEPAPVHEEISKDDDPAAAISRAALEGRSELCRKALHLWVECFGAEAGNLALKALATAGVYLGGGIAPKILPKLTDGTFLAAFRDKARLAPLLEAIPIHVILNDQAALYGAARFALQFSPP